MRSMTFFSLVSFVILSIVAYQADAQTMSWQAEDFAATNQGDGDGIQILEPPLDTADSDGNTYQIAEASGGKFIGTPNGGAGNAAAWVKYEFNVPQGGDWYFWGRVIATTTGDDSFYWGIDIADADAEANADTEIIDVWDFNELCNCPLGDCVFPQPPDWLWFRLSARGNPANGPFPANGIGCDPDPQGIDYENPIPLSLTAGTHTLHIIGREDGTFLDWIYATMDAAFDANENPPLITDIANDTAVELQGKLTTTWGQLKHAR
jgi:hypothetical protein